MISKAEQTDKLEQNLQDKIHSGMKICHINTQEWREKGDLASLKEAEQWNDQGLLLGVIARYLREKCKDD